MAQLLPLPEDTDSNSAIGNFYMECLFTVSGWKDQIKEKEAENGPSLKEADHLDMSDIAWEGWRDWENFVSNLKNRGKEKRRQEKQHQQMCVIVFSVQYLAVTCKILF